jgi:hypothetical protein
MHNQRVGVGDIEHHRLHVVNRTVSAVLELAVHPVISPEIAAPAVHAKLTVLELFPIDVVRVTSSAAVQAPLPMQKIFITVMVSAAPEPLPVDPATLFSATLLMVNGPPAG